MPDDLVDSLRAFLVGGVAQPVAQQRASVANSVAEQRLVSQAEKLREQGLSWREIAHRWNAEGIPTPTGKGKWHDANILRLVKNTERPADHLSHASPIMTPAPSLMRVRMQRAKKSQTLTVTDVSDSAL